jgi:hypothetical protein
VSVTKCTSYAEEYYIGPQGDTEGGFLRHIYTENENFLKALKAIILDLSIVLIQQNHYVKDTVSISSSGEEDTK